MAIARTVEDLQKNPYGIKNGKILQKMELACLEYFRCQKEQIKALQVQCAKRNVPDEPRSLQDLVPALFTHSSYKSYPERWLRDGAWNKMNGWLSRLSVIRPQCDVSNVKTLDNWLDALKTDSLQVTHSSGTMGKPSLFPRTAYEVEMFAKNLTQSLEDFFPIRTGEGVPAFVASFEEGYNVFVLGFGSVARAFGNPKDIHFLFPGKLSAEQARQGAIMKYKYARGEFDPIETKQFEEKAKEQHDIKIPEEFQLENERVC